MLFISNMISPKLDASGSANAEASLSENHLVVITTHICSNIVGQDGILPYKSRNPLFPPCLNFIPIVINQSR